jgi:superfamily II DNA or RNA helicase
VQLGLERFFDSGSLAKGIAYAREGRVTALSDLTPDGQLTAEVLGSGRQTYAVQLRLTFGNDLRLLRLGGIFSFPVGVLCKHMAAAAIAWHVRVAKGSAHLPQPVEASSVAPVRPLPYPVTDWLEALTVSSQITAGPALEYPPTVRDRLVYVLSVAAGKPQITAMKATVQADGRVSDKATRYDVERLKGQENRPQFILRKDLEILRDLEAAGVPANGGSQSGYIWRPKFLEGGPPDLLPILRRIAATGRGRWEERNGPYLHEEGPRSAEFVWHGEEGGTQELRLVCTKTGAPLVALPLATPAWVNPATGTFGVLETAMDPRQLHILMRAPKISAEIAAEVAARLSGFSGRSIPVPKAIGIELRQGKDPVPVLRLFGMRGHRKFGEAWRQQKEPVVQPALRLAFDYDGHMAPARGTDALRFKEGDTLVTLKRDMAAEFAALQMLEGQGALAMEGLEYHSFGKQAEAGDRVFVNGEWDHERFHESEAGMPALQFLGEVVPDLRAAGWRVVVEPSWPFQLTAEPIRLTAQIGNSDAGGLFDFGLMVQADGQQADLAPLIADILAALPRDLSDEMIASSDFEILVAETPCYVQMPDGRHAQVDLRQLTDLLRVLLRSPGLMTKVHPGEAGQLAALAEALEGCGIPFQGGRELLELGKRLNALKSAGDVTPPATLRAVLRPYQAIGYGWLSALSDTGFGGLLADDMGLGKTLQTLALLAKCHLEGQARHPSLLIVPTSLARAWARQAVEFVPDLRVLVLQGNARKALFDQIDRAHLVISTYPLLHRDHDILLTRDWELAILDEAQAVKNPAATAAKRIRDIRARMRLALTGTPMENTLTDLWSLFDWLVPGLLGDRKTFRTQVVLPVEKEGDAQVQARLNRRIEPFLLRRTKDQVVLDLPAKTEITELIPLGAKQQALYETVRMAMDARVRDAIAKRGIQGAQITILDALLRMRQVCCDPHLLKDGAAISDSAKRERLLDMLESLVQEGRKVLVFSQFVEMLRLIEKDVTARNWSYEWLTGDTVDRDGAVTRFQKGSAQIFLISLKAGGVGLTLTAADTVILYDPWWNPAVERQAMDRAHRIGQTKAVFVYRLVAEGTVEEAILGLQARKQALADALFEGRTSEGFAFDQDAIAELFRPLKGEDEGR